MLPIGEQVAHKPETTPLLFLCVQQPIVPIKQGKSTDYTIPIIANTAAK
jgi:hypothetical protein